MSRRMVICKDIFYMFFWVGNIADTGIVILPAEKWTEKVIDGNRVNDWIIVI